MAVSKLLSGGRSIKPNTMNKQFDIIMSNLQKEILQIKTASARGLVLAANHIRNETELSPPYTPLDKGNLRASWFTVSAHGLEKDPLGVSGEFRNNPKVNKKASEFKQMYVTAIGEAKAMVATKAGRSSVMFGYGANYALWVHEMIGAVNWSKEGSGAKWFERAISRNHGKILEIIGNHSRIKK
jgi:hypothetical protein